MSNKAISSLTELTTVDNNDVFPIVDISDTTQSLNGSTKKIKRSNILGTVLNNLISVFIPASTSSPASLDLHEDTDNGTNKITISAPSAVASDKVLTLPDETGTFLSTVSTLAGINKTPLFAPRGFLINGKITVTDTGSGITVSIKTLSGTDASSTDPIYIRIGDTVRTISSALSVTLADGTNWFSSGSTALATKEIDYFVYAVYDSNSSAVALTFARIPYANLVSDFSATTTNEKYCAGYADFTTTDETENIGRFAATLSAGAGYTWSIPTYTATNLIQRPIFETRWLSYTPTVTTEGGAITSTTSASTYLIRERSLFLKAQLTITNAGTGTGALIITVPLSSVDIFWGGAGREYGSTGVTFGLTGSTNNFSVYKYDNGTIIATNAAIKVGVFYAIA